MSERIKGRSRSLLEYQPDIGYIEPDVVSDKPEGLHKTPTDPNRGLVKAKAVQQFAKNIEALAEAAQEQKTATAKAALEAQEQQKANLPECISLSLSKAMPVKASPA